jgi:hypothetical protein
MFSASHKIVRKRLQKKTVWLKGDSAVTLCICFPTQMFWSDGKGGGDRAGSIGDIGDGGTANQT